MADAWGGAWGSAWGVSWGSGEEAEELHGTPVPPPPIHWRGLPEPTTRPRPTTRGRGSALRRQQEAELNARLDDDAIAILLLLQFP